MSVEKYNPKMEYETIPYAQININVIQNITNMEAGFVWVYLQSKPKDWSVIKEHLKNHFKIGDGKIKKIFSYLAKHQLIEYIKSYNDKRQIQGWDIRVLNGTKFTTYPQEKSTGSIIHPLDIHSNGFGALHIKENTNNRKSREPARKKREPLSENFKPDQEREAKAKAVSERCQVSFEHLVDKFKAIEKKKGKSSTDWQVDFELFLLREKPTTQKLANESKPYQEPRCTVPDYKMLSEDVPRGSLKTMEEHMSKIKHLLKGVNPNGIGQGKEKTHRGTR